MLRQPRSMSWLPRRTFPAAEKNGKEEKEEEEEAQEGKEQEKFCHWWRWGARLEATRAVAREHDCEMRWAKTRYGMVHKPCVMCFADWGSARRHPKMSTEPRPNMFENVRPRGKTSEDAQT